jgi:hypothetical protein
MSRRMAIVSSVEGETAQFLRRYECGVTYAAGLVNALTNAINRFLLDPVQLESMRQRAFESWANGFNSHDLYQRLALELAVLPQSQRRAA